MCQQQDGLRRRTSFNTPARLIEMRHLIAAGPPHSTIAAALIATETTRARVQKNNRGLA